MAFRACTIRLRFVPLIAKFFGTARLNLIVRSPSLIALAEPEVRNTEFIGTCVESPRTLRAVAPVGKICALSLSAMAFAI